MNESQQVCPACGRDPISCEEGEGGAIAAVLNQVASLADDLTLLPKTVPEALAVGVVADYLSDRELDLILADPEAYIRVLFEGPMPVTGNHQIN